MVGLAGPVVTLQTGDIVDEGAYGPDFAPEWDGTAMREWPILQADRPMDYTWRNDNSSYTPGKLDYAIVSDGVLQVTRSFGLQTQDMSAERLASYGLLASDTWGASDHLPIVIDVALTGFQAEDGIRDCLLSRGLGDVYKRQSLEAPPQHFRCEEVKSVGSPQRDSVSKTTGKLL